MSSPRLEGDWIREAARALGWSLDAERAAEVAATVAPTLALFRALAAELAPDEDPDEFRRLLEESPAA